ncbi:MAG: hypothetical protein ACI35P_08735 [Bacillus sp. (in: firmicutes)]
MKKWKLLFALLLSVALVACSSDDEAKKEESNDTVEVDKGLLNVEVTLPASFFEGQDIDEVIAQAEEEGVKEVIKNDDGSLTYKMSKSEHKKMMTEMETEIKAFVEEMETSEDYTSIEKVDYNKSFDEFTVTVNREAFENGFDGFALLGLAIQSMYYQYFDGVSEEDYKMTVQLKDAETSEIFDTVVYPDALEALNETEEE